jgi:pimeloyl-ACP methyl ester carboxylesterase
MLTARDPNHANVGSPPPEAGYVAIDGAGHLVPLETPDAFEELLRELRGVARS